MKGEAERATRLLEKVAKERQGKGDREALR